jgi:hypothetical protein
MNVALLTLAVLLGWPVISIVAAVCVGAMAKSRDRVAIRPLNEATTRYEEASRQASA